MITGTVTHFDRADSTRSEDEYTVELSDGRAVFVFRSADDTRYQHEDDSEAGYGAGFTVAETDALDQALADFHEELDRELRARDVTRLVMEAEAAALAQVAVVREDIEVTVKIPAYLESTLHNYVEMLAHGMIPGIVATTPEGIDGEFAQRLSMAEDQPREHRLVRGSLRRWQALSTQAQWSICAEISSALDDYAFTDQYFADAQAEIADFLSAAGMPVVLPLSRD